VEVQIGNEAGFNGGESAIVGEAEAELEKRFKLEQGRRTCSCKRASESAPECTPASGMRFALSQTRCGNHTPPRAAAATGSARGLRRHS
jgi:hypothetical protein